MATYYRWNQNTINYTAQESVYTNSNSVTFRISNTTALFSYSDNVTASSNGIALSASHSEYLDVFQGSQLQIPAGTYFQIDNGSVYRVDPVNHAAQDVYATYHSTSYSVAVSDRGGSTGEYWLINLARNKGKFRGYVYNTNSSTYPTDGISGSYYYDSRTTITSPTDPSNISYPNYYLSDNRNISITWNASVSNISTYPLSNYEIEYAINDSGSYTRAGTSSSNSFTFNIPSNANKIRFRVRAKDTNNQYSSYTTGNWSSLWNFSGFTYSHNDLLYNSSITLSWGLSGPDFKLERKSSSDSDWVQVYSGLNTSFSETVGLWENVQYRIQAYSTETAIGELEYSDILTVYYVNKNIQMNYKESNGLYSLLYPNIEPITTSNILLSTNSASSYSNNVTLDDLLLTTTTSQQGEYTGTGNYGQGNPNKLNFSLRPILLEIEDKVAGEKMDDSKVTMKYNSDSVEWYSGNAEDQMNESGKVYVYRAVLMNDKA